MQWDAASYPIALSTSGEVVPAQANRKIQVVGYVMMAVDAVNVKWQSGSTDKTGLLYPAANGGAVAPIAPGHEFWFETAAGEALNLNLSGSVAVGGHVKVRIV